MKPTCRAISPHDGRQCEFPEGHFPAYQHGGGGNRKSWGFLTVESDDPKHKAMLYGGKE